MSTYDLPDHILEFYCKEEKMDKQRYKELWVEEMSEKTKYKSELEKIIKLIEDEPNDIHLGKRIRALFLDNRNISKKPTLLSGEELEKYKKLLSEQIVEENRIEVRKYIYESPDGGETVYRREAGDYDTPREKVNFEEIKSKSS